MDAFTTLVLVPDDTPDVTAAVRRLLDPYYLWHEAPPHKQYLDVPVLQSMAAQYGLPVTDLAALAAALRKQYGSDQWSVDEEGPFSVTTQNPRGKYENWGFDPESDIWSVSSIPITMFFTGPQSTTLRCIHPTAVVTPDGRWHNLDAGGESTEAQQATIHKRASHLI